MSGLGLRRNAKLGLNIQLALGLGLRIGVVLIAGSNGQVRIVPRRACALGRGQGSTQSHGKDQGLMPLGTNISTGTADYGRKHTVAHCRTL